MTLSATYVSADAPSAARVRTSDARRCWLTRARARGRDVDDDGSHARRSRARADGRHENAATPTSMDAMHAISMNGRRVRSQTRLTAFKNFETRRRRYKNMLIARRDK
tara:strand:- start:1185 stop:1508 length:324 start_codon:yes stop_codon:yes gene_type:complete